MKACTEAMLSMAGGVTTPDPAGEVNDVATIPMADDITIEMATALTRRRTAYFLKYFIAIFLIKLLKRNCS
jgi:hypothetical protein